MSSRAGSFLIAALLLEFSFSGVANADDKCKIATKGATPTAVACTKGGIPEAKKLMKDMVKQAKAKGEKFTCDGCHKDLDSYALTEHANDDYKKLEAVLAKK
jgi:ribosomal protein L10